MRISTKSNKTVVVISSGTPQCPRLLLCDDKTVLRDDYKGGVKIAKGLLKKFTVL